MRTNNRFWTCCLLAFTVLATATTMPAAATNIVYNIVDYPALELDDFSLSPSSISGTIITNGALGSLSASDIVGGSFTFTHDPFSITKPVLGNFEITGILLATPTELLLTSPSSGQNGLILGDLSHTPYTADNYYDLIAWQRTHGGTDSFNGVLAQAFNAFSGGEITSFHNSGSDPMSLGGNDPWVIAAVPEPSALILLGLGLLGLISVAACSPSLRHPIHSRPESTTAAR